MFRRFSLPTVAEDVLVIVACAKTCFLVLLPCNKCLSHDFFEDEYYKVDSGQQLLHPEYFLELVHCSVSLTLQLIFAHCVLSAIKLEEALGNHLRIRLVIGIMVRLKVGMLQRSFHTDSLRGIEGK